MNWSQQETLHRLLSEPPLLIALAIVVWRGCRQVAGIVAQPKSHDVGSAVCAVLIAMGAVLIGGPADAQEPRCLPHEIAVEQLIQRFGEQVMGRGLASSGRAVLELFATETGSWTLLTTDVDGQTCVVASGESWTAIARIKGDPV